MISRQSIERLTAQAKEAFMAMLEENAKTKNMDAVTIAVPLAHWPRMLEVSESFLRFVHARMLMMRNQGGNVSEPWIKLVRPNFTDLVMEMADGMITRQQAYQLAADLSFALKVNRLAMPIPENKNLWLVRSWPADLVLRHVSRRSLSAKDEMDIVRQEFREGKIDRPVKADVDVTILDLPDPTPESVLEYVKRLLFSHKKLRQLHAELQERTAVLEGEKVALEEKLAALDNPWREVVAEIETAIHDTKFHENGL